MITDEQFIALYPLFRLAKQRAENQNPNFNWSLSRDDYLNGRNGIPVGVGVKCVWTLLTMNNDLIELSANQQSFRITPKGVKAVLKYHAEKK